MPGRALRKIRKGSVAPARQITGADADLYAGVLHRRAEHDFGVYRRIIRPNMQYGWFVAELAREAEQFYGDLIAGRRPTMALLTPPQHGKSEFAIDFASWVAGKNPDLKTIYGRIVMNSVCAPIERCNVHYRQNHLARSFHSESVLKAGPLMPI